jgi:hypothetical protein
MTDKPPLLEAQEWLKAWQSINGGVTVDASGQLHPWRVIHDEDRQDWGKRCGLAEVAEKLVTTLIVNPEMHGPLRVMLSTSARVQAARALKGMKE